ncbi:MAG: MBL fold metallo-hydrolase [Deltaproteobacteria bacterium]|jgi:glyoxylase-like metal-dependent hydrolase (beta-lactamase superfamily II)|nr:MBL fold metallo-hydrolase [Deltaproteobacteria bacterium]
MQLAEFALGPLETNSFLLHDEQRAVCIDVGGDPDEVLAYLSRNKLTLTHILITHLHFDHVLGAASLQKATQATLYCNHRDLPMLERQNYGGMFPPITPFSYSDLDEGPLPLPVAECSVLATPGHSPGSLSYYFAEAGVLFDGDVLFRQSIGRTDFYEGDFRTLAESIRNKIYTLPDSTRVCPGHGPSTSVRAEKISNPFVPGL